MLKVFFTGWVHGIQSTIHRVFFRWDFPNFPCGKLWKNGKHMEKPFPMTFRDMIYLVWTRLIIYFWLFMFIPLQFQVPSKGVLWGMI
jgi:hypothetical protein